MYLLSLNVENGQSYAGFKKIIPNTLNWHLDPKIVFGPKIGQNSFVLPKIFTRANFIYALGKRVVEGITRKKFKNLYILEC